MLVRFGQFRRILLTEKRAWRERLTFAFAFGIPVMIGVIARLALGYDGADLSLAGAFLAGCERPAAIQATQAPESGETLASEQGRGDSHADSPNAAPQTASSLEQLRTVDADGYQEVIESHFGDVVLVDMWALW